LTELGRKYPGAIRTRHPIYSFAVIGHRADQFAGIDNKSGYGDDSPFGLLKRLGGKIAILDLEDQNSMTFYHHIEEICGVDYRYFKKFTNSYTNIAGDRSEKTYMLFVRDLEKGVTTDVNPMGEFLWDKGLYRGDRPKTGCGLRTIDAQSLFAFVSDQITRGNAEGLLYSIRKG
jgi:aminoglycoside 3-N-acetyltransferase